MKEFITIAERVQSEITEKKSKFIANLFYVENSEEAEKIIKEIKRKYFDARHNCSCYRILENGSIIEKSSDDGEPSGTAGAPMLNILKNNNLCNILVIVTRYFGGILLGTGGLVRAYSNATIEGLNNAEKLKMCLGMQFIVYVDYNKLENFKYYCNKNAIKISDTKYVEYAICNIELKNEFVSIFETDVENKKIDILKYEKIGDKYIVIC